MNKETQDTASDAITHAMHMLEAARMADSSAQAYEYARRGNFSLNTAMCSRVLTEYECGQVQRMQINLRGFH